MAIRLLLQTCAFRTNALELPEHPILPTPRETHGACPPSDQGCVLRTDAKPPYDPMRLRREVRRLYVDGSHLAMLEAAFEIDRATLLVLLRHPSPWDPATEQRRIDEHLTRDGELKWTIESPSAE